MSRKQFAEYLHISIACKKSLGNQPSKIWRNIKKEKTICFSKPMNYAPAHAAGRILHIRLDSLLIEHITDFLGDSRRLSKDQFCIYQGHT